MKGKVTEAEARELCELLKRLYQEQAAVAGPVGYLSEHARPEIIKHHVNVFSWYVQYLPDTGTILDWGCNHGPDSCLLRKTFGERFDLHACDFVPDSEFRAFRDHAQARYRQLTGVFGLPYPEKTFDVVIASGVLEHTAMDLEALKALYHVLKPEGMLLISYLPYRWSWSEWYRRRVRKEGFHRRLYGRGETATLLKRCGFYPFDIRFQTFVPNVVDGKAATWVKRLLAPLRYPLFSHAVLCCAARKVLTM